MIEMPKYSMLIEWSDEDGAYLVSLPEWRGMVNTPSTHGATYEEAAKNGAEVLEMLMEGPFRDGESLPVPRTFIYAEAAPATSGRS